METDILITMILGTFRSTYTLKLFLWVHGKVGTNLGFGINEMKCLGEQSLMVDGYLTGFDYVESGCDQSTIQYICLAHVLVMDIATCLVKGE